MSNLNPLMGSLCASYIFTLFMLDCQYLINPPWSDDSNQLSAWLHTIERTGLSWAYRKNWQTKHTCTGNTNSTGKKKETWKFCNPIPILTPTCTTVKPLYAFSSWSYCLSCKTSIPSAKGFTGWISITGRSCKDPKPL